MLKASQNLSSTFKKLLIKYISMNNLRAFFSRFASQMPKAGASGAPQIPQGTGSGLAAILVLAGAGVALSNTIITIEPGNRGIIYNRIGGLNENAVLHEGMNFVIPWFQRVIIFDVKAHPQLVESVSGSKDLQMVQIALRVLVKADPNNLPSIYRKLGKDYEQRVLPSIVNEVTKAVVAQYNASELLTKREVVSKQIRDRLVARANDFHILLDDVSITHLAFSAQYTAAVEAKQVAQQESERAKYIVERALQEKKSIVIKAEGEARSAILIGNAIQKNPAFVQLRRIEASKEIANTISGSGNKIYLDADSLMINTLGEQGDGLKGGPSVGSSQTNASAGWFGGSK